MTADRLAEYDVIWTTPSQDASGSMPIGNGDVAANVWVEPSGDLLILVAKGDAWDENSTLCKLGRVRVRFEPPPRASGDDQAFPFRQSLSLEHGMISMRIGGMLIRIWPDVEAGAIRMHVYTSARQSVRATLETWRNYPYRMTPTQTGDLFKNLTGKDPYPTIVTPDVVGSDRPGEVVAYHANSPREDDPFLINLKLQGLENEPSHVSSPLAGRVFGMAMRGRGFETVDQRTIRSAPADEHQIDLYGLTRQPTTAESWRAELAKHIDVDRTERSASLANNSERWRAIRDRSRILVTSSSNDANTFRVTQSYLLQRYLNAAAGRAHPIKHNGSLFTVGRRWDPDFRRWGGPGFWFMNQRLVYWPMLADGDFDLMRPWLKMYRDTLELQRHRTKTYFGHAGAHYPETMTFWGAEVSGHYGWTPFEQRERPEAECAYLTYYWSGAVELVLILAEFVAHTGDAAMAADSLVPIADAVTEFYDHHYPRDATGRLRFEPAQALETWHKAVDPMPEVAGLRCTLARLLALDGVTLPAALADRCRRILADLPPVPVGERDGENVLLPAAEFDLKKNTENPELYCVFPYRLFGVGKPDLALARRTFARRLNVEHTCWHQDAIQMALLGLTEQAKEFVARRVAPENHSDSRFPAFWNAFHDWVPDVDHGGVLQLALQNMLVQCDGRTIRLLPAWPAEWDAEFKLHVPLQTVIEGRVEKGKIVDLKVTPEHRRADVVFGLQETAADDRV